LTRQTANIHLWCPARIIDDGSWRTAFTRWLFRPLR